MAPTTFLFAGKAAPAYLVAKLIIKFINNLAGTIDGDPDCIQYGINLRLDTPTARSFLNSVGVRPW